MNISKFFGKIISQCYLDQPNDYLHDLLIQISLFEMQTVLSASTF